MDENKEKSVRKKKKVGHILIELLLLALIACFVGIIWFAVSVKTSSSPVGYWTITEASSNGVVMTPEDAELIGLDKIGSALLYKSGKCKITLMGNEFEGDWEKVKSSSITISYGNGHVMNAQIDKDNVMTATDENYVDYVLEK